MYDVSRSLRKSSVSGYTMRCVASLEAAAEISNVLLLQALHDRFLWGRYRFLELDKKMTEQRKDCTAALNKKWLEDLEANGYDSKKMERYAEAIERVMTNKSKDKAQVKLIRSLLAEVIMANTHILYTDYKFKKERIKALQNKLFDYSFLIKRQEVQIWDFFECMRQECGVRSTMYEKYRKEHGPADIGPKHAIYLKEGEVNGQKS